MELTTNEAQVLGYIKGCVDSIKRPPSRAEIAKAFNVNYNAAQWWVKKLEEKGYIEIDAGVNRGIRVVL